MWIFSRLTFRIFAIFFLTITLLVTFILALPKLDARNLAYLSQQERLDGEAIAENIEMELNQFKQNDFRWWLRFITAMDNNIDASSDRLLFAITPEGQIISSFKPDSNIVRNFTGLSDNVNNPAKKIYDNREFIGPFLVKYKDGDYKLYMIQPTKSLQSQFITLLFDHPVFLLLAIMLISSPLLLWLSWSLAKPARRLKHAADEVARGNMQEWPELESSTLEFRAVGISFNHMLRELNRMITIQQRLLSDISHELRTPLTRLKLAAALSRRKQGDSSELDRIENEANKLESMIQDLLSLARNQYENNSISERLDLGKLWNDVLNNAVFEAEQLEKTLEIHNRPTEGIIWGNRASLNSALENVIRNAFRYSYHHIIIRFEQTKTAIFVSVQDDGPGVPDDELEQIFRPFYRTSEARDRESGGTGLGLSIVQSTISHHKGKVTASRGELGGLKLNIQLPLMEK